MPRITVIHHKRTTGKPNTFYVGRPTVLGNPYAHKDGTIAAHKTDTLEEAVAKYREYLEEETANGNQAILAMLRSIFHHIKLREDVHLACWCKDEINPFKSDSELCHADVIRDFLLEEAELSNIVYEDD